jgi:TPR repeat protein
MNEIHKEKSASDSAMELKTKIILANLGDSNAQNEIGLAYETGDHVQQDFDKAIEWHKLAADQGNFDSAFRIGRIYHFGLGDDQNFYEASKWYEIASAGNHNLARVNLGMLYINGEGVAQDYKYAEDLFRVAAAQGTHDAQNNLGAMYSMGLGVSPNDEEAFKWYLLAAKQGNQKAQLSIGLMYKDGIGVPQNSEDACRWLYESAAQGDDGAQLHLGWMLIQGDGVPENMQEGLEWLKASASQGNEIAQTRINSLDDTANNEIVSTASSAFLKQFGIALMADYFNISYLVNNSRAQNLYFLVPEPMREYYDNFYSELGVNFSFEIVKESPEKFAWLVFDSEKDKEIVEDYYEAFNFHNRRNEMISFPDIYEGKKDPQDDVCGWYLDAIESFFKNNFESKLPIPFGICEDDPNERMFMLYSENGMIGLYKGSQIFKNSPIRFVNNN